MVGFFQSDVYFRDYPIIKSVIPRSLIAKAAEHMRVNYGIERETHAVALHLRRGDYTRMRHVFEELPLSYYDTALRQLLGGFLLRDIVCAYEGKGHQVKVLIFCEETLFGDTAVGYFASKYAGLDVSLVHATNEVNAPFQSGVECPRDVLELLMIHLCSDVVMANSTFSWWGAYLNEKPLRRVVAPSKWFVQDPYPSSNHLYCDDWILL
ncbi:glycosyl transferase family protein [Strigomonas culicis]|nr:glycosyl transferase family protein [Strigomonas culicis]|eukprot:EPY35124.1 glycosyl transferase family protein [Strigomonas culicis]